MDESDLQRAVKEAPRKVGLAKRASCHTLRHSLAIHLVQYGDDIWTIQEPLGDLEVSTTMMYIHVLNRRGKGDYIPIDRL